MNRLWQLQRHQELVAKFQRRNRLWKFYVAELDAQHRQKLLRLLGKVEDAIATHGTLPPRGVA